MIDNLKDAINHAREVANEKRFMEDHWTKQDKEDKWHDKRQSWITECKECAKEHEQLAEWLTELQVRREADDISFEGMTVSEALHDLENCVLPVVGGKSIRIAIKALKAICDRRKPYESEAENETDN